MGACAFDPQTSSYSGDPVAQAKCLMRGMDATRKSRAGAGKLAAALASRVGQDSGLPSREALSAFLSKENSSMGFRRYLWQPVSRAHDNDADAPPARYFVIHDTSGPNYGHRSFPADIDVSAKLNNLGSFKCSDGWGKAHVVVNRSGGMLLDHDFAIPWRETRFEQAANFAGGPEGALPPRRAHPAAAQRSRSRAAQRRAEPKSGLYRPRNMTGWRCSTSSPVSAPSSGSFRRSMPPSISASATATTIRSISTSRASPTAWHGSWTNLTEGRQSRRLMRTQAECGCHGEKSMPHPSPILP